MEYTTSTPRAERTIAGRKVSVIQPFAEGQPLTEATAAMLNQTLAENFSNNIRAKIDAGVLGADGKPGPRFIDVTTGKETSAPANPLDDAAVQAIVDAYMTEYQPGVRSSSGTPARVVDPVEREARKLANIKADEFVKGKGLKPKDVNMVDVREKIFTKYRDQFMAGGKKVVAQLEAAKRNAAEFSLDDIELTAKEEPADSSVSAEPAAA